MDILTFSWPFHYGKGWIFWPYHHGAIWTVCPCAHALFLMAVWLLHSRHLFLMTQGDLSLMALPWYNSDGWQRKTPSYLPSWRSDLFLMTQCDIFLMTPWTFPHDTEWHFPHDTNLFIMTQCDHFLMTQWHFPHVANLFVMTQCDLFLMTWVRSETLSRKKVGAMKRV